MYGKNIIPAALLFASATFAPSVSDAKEAQSSMIEEIATCVRDWVSMELSVPESPETLFVTADSTSVRKKPEKAAPEIFRLFEGMEINPLERKVENGQTWIRIKVQEEDYWILEENIGKERAPESKERVRRYKIVIDKTARTLTLLKADNGEWKKHKAYPMGLGGRSDTAPKKRNGDGLTPTGKYYISYINPKSNFGKDPDTGRRNLPSLFLSYPNRFDAWGGLQSGLIDLGEYKGISRRIGKKGVPLQNTNLGHHIMIHGGGASDWTAGCVALNDADMKELARLAKGGTPVEIK